MLQDPNVERYVSKRLEPLQKEIKELQATSFKLMQANNLHLQRVSQQRELLLAFADFLRDEKNTDFIYTKYVDEFLKANNCG